LGNEVLRKEQGRSVGRLTADPASLPNSETPVRRLAWLWELAAESLRVSETTAEIGHVAPAGLGLSEGSYCCCEGIHSGRQPVRNFAGRRSS
jgi:hypothetical protein